MGAEDNRVILLPRSATSSIIVEKLRSQGGWREVASPSSVSGCRKFEKDDGAHIIEAEADVDPPRLTLRFALCQPESVDHVFIQAVAELAHLLDAQVRVVNSAEAFPATFDASDGTRIRDALRRSIDSERDLWRREFGEATAKVTCEEAILRFIVGGAMGT